VATIAMGIKVVVNPVGFTLGAQVEVGSKEMELVVLGVKATDPPAKV